MPLEFATALRIANAALSAGKTIVDALKKKGDAALAAQVIEMMETIQQLRDALHDRADAKALLAKRTRGHNTYWVEDDGPYCTNCWDTTEKVVLLHLTSPGYAMCPACKNSVNYNREAWEQHTAAQRQALQNAARKHGHRYDGL